jgi:hypothetical protein
MELCSGERLMKNFLARLFGAGQPKSEQAQPNVPPDPAEEAEARLEELAAYMTRDIASGFYDAEQIVSLAADVMGDEFPDGGAEREARRMLPELIARHRAAESSWPAQTDCDRLDAAFAALEGHGIVCRQNFSCCGTCGAAEIGDEMDAADQAGLPVRGYAFYHQQDTGNAVDGSGLYLNYGSTEPGEEAAMAVAGQIVRELEAHGLTTRWNGTWEQRIGIMLDWKRRSSLELR